MAWDSGSRANLKALHEQGVVAVRYRAEGCNVELEVLDCVGEGQYELSPYSASETKIARTAQELYAELPIGAARLGGRVGGGRALRTDYMLVGVLRIPVMKSFPAEKLKGSCARATHVVGKIYVGGFAMASGQSERLGTAATFFGAGVEGSSDRSAERLAKEGNASACEKAQQEGTLETGCSVPLRVGLVPITGRAEGSCAAGTRWDGNSCVQLNPPPGAPAAVAPPSTASQSLVALAARIRDPRAWVRDPRERRLIDTELAALEKLFENTPQDDASREGLMRRVAEAYVELAAAAQRDAADSSQRANALKVVAAARKNAVKYYSALRTQYPKDEVLYYLALAYEDSGDFKNARKSYYEVIQKWPSSRFVPASYLAFGELFLMEARRDPGKWRLAEVAFKEVRKYHQATDFFTRTLVAFATLRHGDVLKAVGDSDGAAKAWKLARERAVGLRSPEGATIAKHAGAR